MVLRGRVWREELSIPLPWILCGLAVLGFIGLRFWFADRIEEAARQPVIILAGPAVVDEAGRISAEAPASATLSIDQADGSGSGSIGIDGQDDPLWVNPRSSGLPWASLGTIDGLLTFRGNPTRTFHGRGPIPDDPEILWQRTIGCSNSPVGGQPKTWCGSGWTGQPAVFPAPGEREGASAGDRWWVAVGGYNRSVNFYDPASGDAPYPAFETGDIIKGTITIDPDGFPLLYTGSRDNFFHIAAIDGDAPRELWRLSAASDDPTLWNNDWDSSALVVGDHLFVGGENSRFYAVRLRRGYDEDGAVTVDPEVVLSVAGWDRELLDALGDRQVSIENSVAISGTVVYFTNSGGLVQGWDMAGLRFGGAAERVFRFWTGDDTDASIVIDEAGMLYVASEYERGNARARELGQVIKLDPSRPDDPVVWSREAATGLGGGVWATPALHGQLLIVSTDDGRVLGLDRDDGSQRWVIDLPGPLWSSPVVVDDVLIQGDCDGTLHAFDLAGEATAPTPRWTVELDGCIESTPAVWDGRIFVGTRAGDFFAVGDADR
ncbi:MAG: PQQ-binding-like beta-propeller repeat protein [Actinomycetota bacterium]